MLTHCLKTAIKRYLAPLLALGWTALMLSVLWGSPFADAQVFNSGSTGADSALTLTTPGIVIFDPASFTPRLDPDGDNVYHFTTITIGAGVTVRLLATHINGPVFWLASGDVRIDGIIDLNGEDGQSDQDITNNPRASAIAGSGGFGGGFGLNGSLAATSGFGPGGGSVGTSGCVAGGGSHAVQASNGCAFSGPAYGNDFLVPLIGGSGGGGGAVAQSFGLTSSSGGGAGGGALLIASSTSMTVNGTIRANGGTGGNCVRLPNSCNGGGGSGGAIHLLAPTMSVVGTLSATGGIGSPFSSSSSGRIRVESFQRTVTGSTTPTPVFATPFGIFLPPSGGSPSVRVVSVAGIPVPANPTGSFTMPDVTINNITSPVTVAIEARNIPLGTVVQLYLFSETTPSMTVNSTPLAGTLDHSTATATTTIPSGFSQGFVRATWTQ